MRRTGKLNSFNATAPGIDPEAFRPVTVATIA